MFFSIKNKKKVTTAIMMIVTFYYMNLKSMSIHSTP